MHLLANRLSFFFGIKIHLLYFFLPRSSRKNAHSLLRYFGIRGIAGTSFSLPNCRFAPETQKRSNPFPAPDTSSPTRSCSGTTTGIRRSFQTTHSMKAPNMMTASRIRLTPPCRKSAWTACAPRKRTQRR